MDIPEVHLAFQTWRLIASSRKAAAFGESLLRTFAISSSWFFKERRRPTGDGTKKEEAEGIAPFASRSKRSPWDSHPRLSEAKIAKNRDASEVFRDTTFADTTSSNLLVSGSSSAMFFFSLFLSFLIARHRRTADPVNKGNFIAVRAAREIFPATPSSDVYLLWGITC